jgi:hypothetical protein
MRVALTLSIMLAAAAPLAGCGHSEVKAPCSASEGYMSLGTEDRCGPMRPINEPPKATSPEQTVGSIRR